MKLKHPLFFLILFLGITTFGQDVYYFKVINGHTKQTIKEVQVSSECEKCTVTFIDSGFFLIENLNRNEVVYFTAPYFYGRNFVRSKKRIRRNRDKCNIPLGDTINFFLIPTEEYYDIKWEKDNAAYGEIDTSNIERSPDTKAYFDDSLALNYEISKNLTYSSKAMDENIQGIVVVAFVIEEDGQVTNIHIHNSPSEHLSRSALGTFRKINFPKSHSGTKNGLPVRTISYLSIRFVLDID